MILLIDNYDSFTYNLVQFIGEVTKEAIPLKVIRNDALDISEILRQNPSHIVLSPGPCTPNEAGVCMDIVKELGATVPILGVCLGHQCIAQALGGNVIRSAKVYHGKTSAIFHDTNGIFKKVEQGFIATRYHSLIVEKESLPAELEVSAWTQKDDGAQNEIMGLRHKLYPHLIGVQFHPESILTFVGKTLLSEFVCTKLEDFK